MKRAHSHDMHLLRRATAFIFLLAGAAKLLHLPTFAALLAHCNVPYPAVCAALVPTLELGGGVCLLRNKWVRPAAAMLAVDMACAIMLIGSRGVRFQIGGVSVGGEVWRLPLETVLLVSLFYIGVRKQA